MGNIAAWYPGLAARDIPATIAALMSGGATGIVQVVETSGGFIIVYNM
jgi:hypothetical protein